MIFSRTPIYWDAQGKGFCPVFCYLVTCNSPNHSPDMENYYNSEIGVYFLDRNRAVFEQVLMYFYSDKEFYPVRVLSVAK